jgi:hypothetical protein
VLNATISAMLLPTSSTTLYYRSLHTGLPPDRLLSLADANAEHKNQPSRQRWLQIEGGDMWNLLDPHQVVQLGQSSSAAVMRAFFGSREVNKRTLSGGLP